MEKRLGPYLRSLRQAKHLTTRQLAAAVGCTDAFISYSERGERLPSLSLLWRLIQALDGQLGEALYYLCVDAGVPEEEAEAAVKMMRRADAGNREDGEA